MSRFYKKINTTMELQELQAEASKVGATAIGMSGTGSLYVHDGTNHRQIQVKEAAEILDTTVDEIQKFIVSKGEYEILDLPSEPVDQEEPVEEVMVPEESQEEFEEPEEVEDSEEDKRIEELEIQVQDLENRLSKVEQTLDSIMLK